ncbi:MAG: putative RND superfamily exporter protein, partial [Bacteroidia bacterium]
MWEKFSVLIIRNRIVLIVLLALISVFMGYKASFVELTYDNPKFIPDNDEEYQLYQDFKKT